MKKIFYMNTNFLYEYNYFECKHGTLTKTSVKDSLKTILVYWVP